MQALCRQAVVNAEAPTDGLRAPHARMQNDAMRLGATARHTYAPSSPCPARPLSSGWCERGAAVQQWPTAPPAPLLPLSALRGAGDLKPRKPFLLSCLLLKGGRGSCWDGQALVAVEAMTAM
jgi:hypothetical protein